MSHQARLFFVMLSVTLIMSPLQALACGGGCSSGGGLALSLLLLFALIATPVLALFGFVTLIRALMRRTRSKQKLADAIEKNKDQF